MAVNAVMSGAFSGVKMVTVGDDKESIDIWKRFFPDSVVLSSLSLSLKSRSGNHNLSKDDLPATKDDMNVDMLVDFFTLALCGKVVTTYNDSRFAREARRLAPTVRAVLGNENSAPNRK
jgi:hypothetical protein